MKLLLATLCLLIPAAHAQERTAAGPLETQMTWTTLKNLVDDTNTKITATNNRLDQIEKCGKQKKLYGPGTTGADADGCVSVQTHMHWNTMRHLVSNQYGGFTPAATTVTSAAPSCASFGESPVQMNFCTTAGRTCHTTTPYSANCTGRGSGTGCNGNPTRATATLWACM